jgi:hypothetical protein
MTTSETHDYLAEARALYEQAVEDKRAEIASSSNHWAARVGRGELASLLLKLDAIDEYRRNRDEQQADDKRVQAMSLAAKARTAAQESIAESLRAIAVALTPPPLNLPSLGYAEWYAQNGMIPAVRELPDGGQR